MRTSLYTYIVLLVSLSVSGLSLSPSEKNSTLSARLVTQFPNETWIENLAIRENGQLLVTVATTPELYQVDPYHTPSAATLVLRIPGVTSLLGIVELQKDVFYFIAGNFSFTTFTPVNGSYSVWKVDMAKSNVVHGKVHPRPIVSKVAGIPEATFLNGMVVLNKSKGLVLVGDGGSGSVLTLNVETGKYSKTIEDPTMAPAGQLHLGINGIKIRGKYLYYGTTGQSIFCRIPINIADGTSTGKAEVIAKNVFIDDFSFDDEGNAFAAQNVQDTVAKIAPNGRVTVVAGSLNSTLVAGATATEFGKTRKDRSVLYVTTSGGIGGPVQVEGGKVVALYN